MIYLAQQMTQVPQAVSQFPDCWMEKQVLHLFPSKRQSCVVNIPGFPGDLGAQGLPALKERILDVFTMKKC